MKYLRKEHHNTLDKRTDAAKAIRDLNLRETLPLDEGLARTIAWQKQYYGFK